MASSPITTTVTELPESRVRVEAEVAAHEVQRTVERATRKLGRNMRMSGFRKGKLPPAVVIKRVGRPAVLKEAMREGLPRWYTDALDDSGVTPVGDPKLKLGKLESEAQPMDFSFEVGVCPKATLGRYKGLEVGRREPVVEDEAVEAELEALRERHARPHTVDRPARRGDVLVIDFAGTVEGEPFEGGRGRDQMVELGSGMLVPGFEEQLEGASAGEQRTVEIDFPEVDVPTDHRAEGVSGRRATFTVTVKDVQERQLPALDDELAREAGGFGSLAELRDDIAARLREADERRVAADFREAVLDAAAAEATVELPDHLIEARAREMWQGKLMSLAYEGVGKEVYLQITGRSEEQLLADLRPDAAHQLRREAVLAAVIEEEDIKVSKEALRAAGGVPANAAAGGLPGAPLPGASSSDSLVEALRTRPRPSAVRGELAQYRAKELMAAAAVPVTVEEAKERGLRWTPEKELADQEAAELWSLES